MAQIRFEQLAQAIITEQNITATVIFFPNGEMHDLIYGEIPTKDAIKYTADGYRIFSITVPSTNVDRVELEKIKINIIDEYSTTNQ